MILGKIMYGRKAIVYLLLLGSWLPSISLATHNRAGEITYKRISGYTFEFKITTYTYALSGANRASLPVSWGDGTSQEIGLTSRINLPNDYLFNTYVATHTFPGPGTYRILMEDPNRNEGVSNIPNSVNVIFSIQTLMLIEPFIGTNSTPVLLNPPIDKAARNHTFIHNPAAYDSDGDSISYSLTVCTEAGGRPIEGYTFPTASDTLYVDPVSGDLTWITPVDLGVYNIAMYIDEWRNGIKIGRITRDMQIDVYDTDNNPPVNQSIPDFCVEAGDTITFLVTSTDTDNDAVKQTMTGAPFFDGTATLELIEAGAGFSTSRFTWITNCNQAQQQPYSLVLKSEDVVTDVSLVDITSFQVRVLHNAPKNLVAEASTDNIKLNWKRSNCGIPQGYNIYRRIGSCDFIPDSCENGLPGYTGYSLIGQVDGQNDTTFIDDDQGQGLVPGFDYCYRITAFYGDGAESFASNEICAILIPGLPAMLQVSVLEDNASTGEISVKWAKPIDFDTIDDGPYIYEVYRQSPNETSYSLIDTIHSITLADTSFIDKNINTLQFPYYYSVRLLYLDSNNEWILYPGYESASSMYLNLIGKDNTINIDVLKRSPWLNKSYAIFRKAELEVDFDSITSVNNPTYADINLGNQVPYTYRVKSSGERPLNNRLYQTNNISHLNTTSAVDTIFPCAPLPSVISVCDSAYNLLSWLSPKAIWGSNDVVNYLIYYSPSQNTPLQLIETLNETDTVYIHRLDIETLAAIYGVAAVDSFGNTSKINTVSIDSCLMFSLPNVFSPNGDEFNDMFVSYNLGGFVKRVDMTIFNRYGQVVYKTTDPDVNWNGIHKDSKKTVSTGVYYYICDVFEPRLTGEVHRTLKGFIHVYSGNETNISSE